MPKKESQEEPKTFDEAYVKELREESKGYRAKLREIESIFEGLTVQETAVLQAGIKKLVADPTAGALEFRDIAYRVLGDDKFYDGLTKVAEEPPKEPEVAETPQQTEQVAAPAGDTPLTRAELDQYFADRDAKAEKQKADVQAVQADARALGYEPGTKAYDLLLSTAFANGGNMNAAAETIKEFAPPTNVAAPAAEGEEGQEQPVTPAATPAPAEGSEATAEAPEFPSSAGAGGVGSQSLPENEAPTTWAEARTAGLARLSSIEAAGT